MRIVKKLICAAMSLLIILTMFPVGALALSERDIRNKVLSIANDEVGYEGSSSYSKYGEWYGYQGGWCTTFVLWCENQAGESLGVKLYGKVVPSGGNCNSMISWFKNKGRYHERSSDYTPKKGDLVFFDWSGNGSSQHVGFVSSTSGSTVYTVEGNCSGKVKAREYTSSGSKPYNNISSIMGYGSPDYSSLAGGSSSGNKTKKTSPATTKKQSTSARTTRRQTQQTTRGGSSNNTTAATTASTTTSTTTTTTTTKATTQAIPLEKLDIYASVYDLQVGENVKLDYTVEPSNAPAVVGYFCDDEGIIEIGKNGNIKAIGEGTATVVVCANDELYAQCDFKVTEAVADVTEHSDGNTTRKVVGTAFHEETEPSEDTQEALTKLGINVNQLEASKSYFAIPIAIAGTTLIISIFIAIIKKIKKR